jgi:hypothetical protein
MSKLRLMYLCILCAFAFATTNVLLAQSIVAQAGPTPISIDQTSTTDNIQVLMASLAQHPSDITVYGATDGRKNFYVQYFTNVSDYLTWSVSVPATASYQPTIYFYTTAGQQFNLSVNGNVVVSFTATGGWQRQIVSSIDLPAGIDRITLTRTGTLSGDANVKSIELLRASNVAAYNSRVVAAKADTSWLSHAEYGLMFQYGSWGFPNGGGAALPLNLQAADFNVTTFVNNVVATGASYVIWSISWWGYHLDAPLTSPDQLVTAQGGPAYPGLTAPTDLIGNVAAALHAKGIRFMLYYHTGDEDTAWWPYQKFPNTFSPHGYGDRSIFFNNWKTVIAEIGLRYGRNLDGLLFDDGCIYYPAPFESLEAAARVGNPNRLVSWNGGPFGDTPVTDFQDLDFGEGLHGAATSGSAAVGGNGIFNSGANAGLLQHGMFTLEQDWGVHYQGEPIASNGYTASQITNWIQSAASRGVPVSLDLMMYEDGTMSSTDLAMLSQVKQNMYGTGTGAGGMATTTINDGASGIAYGGTFSVSTGRGVGDYNDDVHYSTNNGDSASYTFIGSGVDFLTETYSDEGNVAVYIDGTLAQNVSAVSSARQVQQVLFSQTWPSSGTHTIKVVKLSGAFMLVDAFRVD